MGFEGLMAKAEEIRQRALKEAIADVVSAASSVWAGKEGNKAAIAMAILTETPRYEKMFADIPSLFEPYTYLPDPARFDAPIQRLLEALGKLASEHCSKDPFSSNGIYFANPVMSGMSSAASDIAGWSGAAAQQFRTGYLTPFPAIVNNQFMLVAALKAALEAERAMWASARENIWTIADNTFKRLEHMDDCGKNEWTMSFTVLSSIAAVTAAITGGMSLIVATTLITAVGAAAQVVAAAEVVKNPPQMDITGESAEQVINSMRQAIGKQHEMILLTEGRIRDRISELSNAIHTYQSATDASYNVFFTKRPALADTRAATIRHDMGYTD